MNVERITHYHNADKKRHQKRKRKNSDQFKSYLDNAMFVCLSCGEPLEYEERDNKRHDRCHREWVEQQNREFDKKQLSIFDLWR